MFFAPSKSRQRAKIWNRVEPKTSDHIQINIRMQNPSQEPPASSKAPFQDLNDMDVLASLNSRQRAKFWNMGVLKTIDHIQINIKMPNSSQEPLASFNSKKLVLKDMDALCTFKIKIESQNIEFRCIKDQYLNPNQDQNTKPQSETFRVLQSPKW